jgi:hypothetical protein
MGEHSLLGRNMESYRKLVTKDPLRVDEVVLEAFL